MCNLLNINFTSIAIDDGKEEQYKGISNVMLWKTGIIFEVYGHPYSFMGGARKIDGGGFGKGGQIFVICRRHKKILT